MKLSVPAQRGVLRKERSSGAYRLSAFYIANMVSEFPLTLSMPMIFWTLVYWMSGLGGVVGYLVFIGSGLLNCLVAQVSEDMDTYMYQK